MFNLFTYEKKLNEVNSLDKLKQQFLQEKQKKKELNEKYAQNYKKRIENFIINMIENPVVLNMYSGPRYYKIREEDPSKFLGDPQIYVTGFKHEKDRIKMALEHNQNLDFQPNQRVENYSFRDRHIEKEIHPQMRFTSKTSLERIESYVKENTMTQVENIDFRVAKKLFKKGQYDNIPDNLTQQQRRVFLSQQIAKNILPSLHQKTHFQAAQVMYNNMPIPSLKENSKSVKGSNSQSTPNLFLSKSNDGLGLVQDEVVERSKDKTKTNISRLSILPQIRPRASMKNVQILENQGSADDMRSPSDSARTKADKSASQDPLAKAQKQAEMMEAFNPIQTSQQILMNCKLIRPKNLKVKQLHKGDGHLISTLDKSISDVYKELFSNSIFTKSTTLKQSLSTTQSD